MSLFLKKCAIISGLLIFFLSTVQSQSLFDAANSARYASYLFNNHEYDLSVKEYRRVLSFHPEDTLARLRLVSSLRYLDQLSQAIDHIDKTYPGAKRDSMPASLAEEYCRLLIMTNRTEACGNFLSNSYNISSSRKQFFMAATQMMEHQWEAAYETLQSEACPQARKMKALSRSAMEISYKKPWLSVGMSALVPGMGKVYTGHWKDGLVSFLFTSLSAWQAYRGFSEKGLPSVYGWIYGAAGAGFYMGGLYGSGKAAHQYNYEQNKKIIDAVEDLYIRY